MTEMSTISNRTAARDISFSIGESSLGHVLVAGSEKGVCAILFGDDDRMLARELRNRFPDAVLKDGGPEFDWLADKVIDFVGNPVTVPDFPLDPRGTEFEHKVWNALRDIPPGKTATYGDIAKSIGMPQGAREVGEACASNAIAVAIPCHRVVKSDGSLSGYRWGVARKRKLLNKEALACPVLRSDM